MTAEAALAGRADAMRREVRDGLGRAQKELPPKYFYDSYGSELFERITGLPEYYPTRTERALLERWAPDWIQTLRARAVVELGAGSAAKTRIILDAVQAAGGDGVYVPVDVSGDFLASTAALLCSEYPDLAVVPIVADMATDFLLPEGLPAPVLHAFLGSTIGNFRPDAAVALLVGVRQRMAGGDRFLVGVDLHKDAARLEAAYNDAAGVTAEFNLNVLRVLNRELGAEFDLDRFRHHAFYNADDRCIEMHLVSVEAQRVRIPGVGVVEFAPGETIRTEISCKHDRASVEWMLNAADLRIDRWETDGEELYALSLVRPI